MRVLVGCAMLFGLVGCATTSAVHLGAQQARPTVPWEKVAVYRDSSQVPGEYVEVGLLHATGDWGWSGEGTMYNSMKKAAGQMGANAIILGALTEPGTGAKVASTLFGMPAERKGKALAIYVFSQPDTTALGEAR